MLRFALGYVSQDELKQHLQNKLPAGELTTLYSYMTGRSPRKRVRALIVIFYLYGVPRESISNLAIVCCRACRSHPIIFISASFNSTSVRWTPHSLLGSS
jgi:hypothetical protein